MQRIIGVLLFFVLASAQAALVDRGGGFIYDDVQDITWTQNANINGAMDWNTSVAWADSLSLYDAVRDVTWDDWRLATTLQPDASCSNQSGASYGLNCTGSEMGHLFNVDGISGSTMGLFTNVQSRFYWSGTEYAPGSNDAWGFSFDYGFQFFGDKNTSLYNYAWAVRGGDVAASVVPIPAAVWLFGSGLGLLGWLRRRPGSVLR